MSAGTGAGPCAPSEVPPSLVGPSVGLDLGERRIGVAVGDGGGTTSVPAEVVERSGDRPADHRRLLRVVRDVDAAVVVVGLPLSLDGSVGPAAKRVLAEVDELRSTWDVPVVTHDERFSTAEAHASLRGAGLDERARRRVVDAVAASVILQSWLDSQRARQDSTP
ncbi:MAG: Holliday junction resolvase RuvX [Acidobacteria bacterium]|nr:Holliday junction resolvase RuvX [Acidobacteriota bacterium]